MVAPTQQSDGRRLHGSMVAGSFFSGGHISCAFSAAIGLSDGGGCLGFVSWGWGGLNGRVGPVGDGPGWSDYGRKVGSSLFLISSGEAPSVCFLMAGGFFGGGSWLGSVVGNVGSLL